MRVRVRVRLSPRVSASVCVGCVSRGSADGSRYQAISGVLAGTMKGEKKQKRLLGVMLCRGSRGWAPRAFIVELGIG